MRVLLTGLAGLLVIAAVALAAGPERETKMMNAGSAHLEKAMPGDASGVWNPLSRSCRGSFL